MLGAGDPAANGLGANQLLGCLPSRGRPFGIAERETDRRLVAAAGVCPLSVEAAEGNAVASNTTNSIAISGPLGNAAAPPVGLEPPTATTLDWYAEAV